MKIEIKKIDGHWTVNDKRYNEMNLSERKFFDEFLAVMRCEKKESDYSKRF